MKINKFNLFDPRKSFLSLPILWVVIFSLIAIAAYVAYIIMSNEQLGYQFDHYGFNNFLTIFKVPLGILALIIPIVALLAANHRSEQTKEQILSNNQQNIFSNYYKHIEEFEKYIDSHISNILLEGRTSDYTFLDKRNTHTVLFPDSWNGDYKLNRNAHKQILEKFSSLYEILKGDSYNPKDKAKWLINIEDKLEEIENSLYLFWNPKNKHVIKINNHDIPIRDTRLKQYYSDINLRVNIVKMLFKFDRLYTPENILQAVCNMNLDLLPDNKINENTTLPIISGLFKKSFISD